MSWPDAIDGLCAADVMHYHLTTLPATTTVEAAREYFAVSTSRRLAVITDSDRFVGTLDSEALPADADGSGPASAFATVGPVVHPQVPASEAREVGLQVASRRVPVVDDAGRLVGIVAVNRHLDGFCGYVEPAAT